MPKIIDIIHKDDELLIINKPAGFSVTKDRTGKPDIVALLRKQLGPDETILLVHRIDKPTSGIMLIARTKDAQRKYAGCFAKRKIEKTYLAIVSGVVPDDTGTIKRPIAPSKKQPGTVYVSPRRGKQAVTEYRLLADFGLAALVAANPITGRTHQIRIHFADIGCPLAIDPLYGSSNPLLLSDFKPKYRLPEGKTERPLIETLTLHAYQITLPADETHTKPRKFTAPLPKKFNAAIKMLTKHNPAGPDAFLNYSDFERITNSDPI
ncbi:Ribosomal large subunit pseudouridine synthase C [Anaerohalosphaera lusitana]|uniref:Ribosomal large subunit pseudouridine synthase C n=1 Tax=Anaerohalosphaera lusitana TaxID=1936003 RepID=A0A1U9NN79_9BACT|nr:RluA family pseudouridine synthase [Anaerohalosphaera lusitana]AQT69295.1 Ribosomal large subunit pseudouridine synthase C [Anaerohalosphaera lusitana]